MIPKTINTIGIASVLGEGDILHSGGNGEHVILPFIYLATVCRRLRLFALLGFGHFSFEIGVSFNYNVGHLSSSPVRFGVLLVRPYLSDRVRYF